MIGLQTTGLVAGVHFVATAHEGLRVMVNGKPARLAVIDDKGNVLAAGDLVAQEAEAICVNNYRNMLQGLGHMRIQSKPLDADPAATQERMHKPAAKRA